MTQAPGETVSAGKSAIHLEFEPVDLILASGARTTHIDAFCLTWIKFERQLRKLTANILYQATAFPESDETAKQALRGALLARSNLKYDHFTSAIWKLTGHSAKEMLGARYKVLKAAVDDAYGIRNKVFHGQQTGLNLGKEPLEAAHTSVREWCTIMAHESSARFGYDGFSRNSLRKTRRPDVTAAVDQAIAAKGWEEFVKRL